MVAVIRGTLKCSFSSTQGSKEICPSVKLCFSVKFVPCAKKLNQTAQNRTQQRPMQQLVIVWGVKIVVVHSESGSSQKILRD